MKGHIKWLRVQGPPPGVSEIAAMTALRAFYNGSGWYRIGGDDAPVREYLRRSGRKFEPGRPPDHVVNLGRREAAVLAVSR